MSAEYTFVVNVLRESCCDSTGVPDGLASTPIDELMLPSPPGNVCLSMLDNGDTAYIIAHLCLLFYDMNWFNTLQMRPSTLP